MPITTNSESDYPSIVLSKRHTLVDKLQLGDDVESDLREFVLEHLQEHGEKVVDGSTRWSANGKVLSGISANILLLAENRGQAANLRTEGSAHMLGSVGDEILNAAHDIGEENRSVDKGAEAGNLTGNSGSDFGLVVLQQLHKGRN